MTLYFITLWTFFCAALQTLGECCRVTLLHWLCTMLENKWRIWIACASPDRVHQAVTRPFALFYQPAASRVLFLQDVVFLDHGSPVQTDLLVYPIVAQADSYELMLRPTAWGRVQPGSLSHAPFRWFKHLGVYISLLVLMNSSSAFRKRASLP